MRTLSIVLLSLWALACTSASNPNDPGTLGPTWAIDAPGQSRGLGVTPDGNVVFAVGSGAGAFADTGGVMIVDSGGEVLAELPLEVPKLCEGCTRLAFHPDQPHVVGNTAWVMDKQGNLFRIDLTKLEARHVPLTGWDQVLWLAGLDRHSALSRDGSRAFLPGVELAVLHLESGTVEKTIDFGALVRSIVHLRGDDYLIDRTDPLGDEGELIVWNAATGEIVAQARLPSPVVGTAVRDGWAVAALEVGIGESLLVELEDDLSDASPISPLSIPSGPIHLALLPEEGLIAVGSGGSGFVSAPEDILPGTTVIVDVEEGPLADLETSSVRALSFSPDGRTLYVADTGGLKAFTLP